MDLGPAVHATMDCGPHPQQRHQQQPLQEQRLQQQPLKPERRQLGNRGITQGQVAAQSAVASGYLANGWRLLIGAAIAGAVARLCARALSTRNRTWLSFAVAGSGLFLSFLIRADHRSPGSPGFFLHAGTASAFAVALTLCLRPWFGHAQLRAATQILWASLTVGLCACVLATDSRIGTYPLQATPVTRIVVGLAISGAVAALGAVRLAQVRQLRRVDVLLVHSVVAYLFARLVDTGAHGRIGAFLTFVVVAIPVVAGSGSDCDQAGLAFDRQTLVARVRLWPIVLMMGFATAMGAASASIETAGPIGTSFTVLGCLFTLLFRHISGGHGLLIIPFTQPERAANRVFEELVYQRIRLIGRPVRRSIDGAVVAIEADPEWPQAHRSSRVMKVNVRIAAAVAGLDSVLDAATIELAAAHAPAVRQTLGTDQAWLSVPIGTKSLADHPLRPDHLDDGDDRPLEGVTFRVRSWPHAEDLEPLRRWRALGARFQFDPPDPTRSGPLGDGNTPDIVTLHSIDLSARWWEKWVEARNGFPLLRHRGKPPISDPSAVFLSVNADERPVGLGLLLSAVARQNADEYVKRINFTETSFDGSSSQESPGWVVPPKPC